MEDEPPISLCLRAGNLVVTAGEQGRLTGSVEAQGVSIRTWKDDLGEVTRISIQTEFPRDIKIEARAMFQGESILTGSEEFDSQVFSRRATSCARWVCSEHRSEQRSSSSCD